MDQLKALEILELDINASKKEIKEAYVRLSKIYHPEENPEKFQQIHEAYTYLLKNQRITKPKVQEVNKVEEVEKEIISDEQPLDFDMVENAAIIKEREMNRQLILHALDDFSRLLTKENKDKNKVFKAFFNNEAYVSIIRDGDFVYELARVLAKTELKKTIYDYIIDFYRLRGENEQTLNYGYRALYQVLASKRGMKAKTKESVTLASIPFIIFMTIFREIRLVARAEDFVPVLVGIMILVFIFYGFYKLYLHLYENYSNLKAQTLTALAIIGFHIIVIIFDIYKYILVDSVLGTAFAGGVILLALLWLIIILIVYIFKHIKRNLKH